MGLFTLYLLLTLQSGTLVLVEVPGFATKASCLVAAKASTAVTKGDSVANAEARCVGPDNV